MSVLEWIVTPERFAVVASSSGRFWLLRVDGLGADAPFLQPMSCEGSTTSTETLLLGAISLGLQSDVSGIKSCASNLPEYVIDLIGSFHNAGRTVGNYRKAAARFRELGRMDLSDYLERHAREENGHEKLAVRDLNALGYPGERMVANYVPPGVARLCELFDRFSSSDYPIGCIGYSYVFESSAAKRSKADIEGLQVLCKTGQDATRFMRAHSSMGSEIDHVRDMVGFIAGLPASDRTEIAKAAHETAVAIREGADLNGTSTDAEMWTIIHEASKSDVATAA